MFQLVDVVVKECKYFCCTFCVCVDMLNEFNKTKYRLIQYIGLCANQTWSHKETTNKCSYINLCFCPNFPWGSGHCRILLVQKFAPKNLYRACPNTHSCGLFTCPLAYLLPVFGPSVQVGMKTSTVWRTFDYMTGHTYNQVLLKCKLYLHILIINYFQTKW